MQQITENQIKTISKEIVKLSKNNTTIKHSNILEIISKSLGYRDYNSLISNLNKIDSDISDDNNISEIDKLLISIKNIKEELESKKDALSSLEIIHLNDTLKNKRLDLSKAYTLESSRKLKTTNDFTSFHQNKILNSNINNTKLKTCPNCNGQGEFILGLTSGSSESMYYDYEYGDFSAVADNLEYKECFWCEGTGRLTDSRMNKVKKMKST